MKHIKIRVNKKGEVKIEAFGYEGEECLTATKWYEDALGGPVERDFKPEFEVVNNDPSITQES